MNKLTAKQAAFVREYVTDWNATQAAIRAGYTEKTAEVTGSKLLINPKVQQHLAKVNSEIVKRSDLTTDRLVKEYKSLAYSNITDYLNEDGTIALEMLKTMPKEMTAAIESVQIVDGFDKMGQPTRTVKIKLYSKTTALEAIAKHLGWFEKDNAQKPTTVVAVAPPVVMHIHRDERKTNPTIDITENQ